MEGVPVICKIECDNRYATFGMPERYTMRMLYEEFHMLKEGWRLLPVPCYRRDAHGWVIHETLMSDVSNNGQTTNDDIQLLPAGVKKEQREEQRRTCAQTNCK
jgi:hypothetical protein